MGRGVGKREAIIAAAAKLFRQRGYAGVGVDAVLAEAQAPKGSLYHYFPGGKAEIGAAALSWGGDAASRTVRKLAAELPPDEALLAYAAKLADWMERSGFRDGCPIATIVLETVPADARMTEAGRKVFNDWRDAFAAPLAARGVPEARARSLAVTAVAALEGALVVARTEQSCAPVLTAATEMAALFRSAYPANSPR